MRCVYFVLFIVLILIFAPIEVIGEGAADFNSGKIAVRVKLFGVFTVFKFKSDVAALIGKFAAGNESGKEKKKKPPLLDLHAVRISEVALYAEQGLSDAADAAIVGGALNILADAARAVAAEKLPKTFFKADILSTLDNRYRVYIKGIITARIANITLNTFKNFITKRMFKKWKTA